MATKAFDCVEMKNRIQAERIAEYEAHKHEYASFLEFVKARAEKSEWVKRVRAKIRPTGIARKGPFPEGEAM